MLVFLIKQNSTLSTSTLFEKTYIHNTQHATNSTMKLIYFDIPGKAEAIRLCAAVGKVAMEDVRITRDEFAAMKESGRLPFGQVPSLEVDGQVFGQSKTIERFVAKRVGMMGANAIEEAQIDCVCEHLRDCKDKYMKAKTNPETKAAYFATEMPEFMAKVEKTCVGPWLCGSKCTLADAAAFVFVKEFFDDVESSTKAIAGCPKIAAAVEAFGKLPEVLAWQKSRPKTMF